MQKNTEWSTEMEISLIIIDDEERHKGRGFMKQVKERWNAKQSACKSLETTHHDLKKITRS